jgi:hypothetical protein
MLEFVSTSEYLPGIDAKPPILLRFAGNRYQLYEERIPNMSELFLVDMGKGREPQKLRPMEWMQLPPRMPERF